ncbi:Quercetin 2,3-dioxygenase [Janthinobacterium sp. KBS0711]|uniref:pirin family protein n=1 Tax=Janthinobacterium sp. KBS0711 TaxID=1649647 RepID=UPI00062808F0|nr:pirin family protein [Janthinobacterium sp. KBS0711]KKO62869.1 Quercetin 2,3-dioxygenase [Janthinobacterium sp. KBS0711]TSD73098.1 pirin family protein [Janthinobacterium sp. KBS0711]
MLQIRHSEERGAANHGWLNSHHSFSFGSYHDPLHMGFGPLLVINEDRVTPGQGFGTHGHRDMEIISYVLDGALEHKDSMGTGSVLHYGDVQRMSAGSGVRHSEFNHSATDGLHFLQIWIQPNVMGIPPSYEEKHFTPESKRGKLRLIASSDGRQGSVLIHQDAAIYASILQEGEQAEHALEEGRLAYVHLIRGSLVVNGTPLKAGDALKLTQEASVIITQPEDAEFLLFDLPK